MQFYSANILSFSGYLIYCLIENVAVLLVFSGLVLFVIKQDEM
jgi:hypothetical protein